MTLCTFFMCAVTICCTPQSDDERAWSYNVVMSLNRNAFASITMFHVQISEVKSKTLNEIGVNSLWLMMPFLKNKML